MKPIFGAIMLLCLLTETTFGVQPIGYYTLTKGTSSEVCVAYVRNLNSFLEIRPYMRCERHLNPEFSKIHPEFSDFSEPTWQRIDKWEYIKLVKQIIMLFDNSNDPKFASPNELEDWLNTSISLHFIRVDIDNDKSVDRVIRYNLHSCGASQVYASPIMVVDDQMESIDVEATRHLLQNPSWDKNKNPTGGWFDAMYDVFLYKGQAYFDKWSDNFNEKGYLHVFKTEQGATQEVCTLKFEFYPGEEEPY